MALYLIEEAERVSSGKGTRELNTTRATASDIEEALAFVNRITGIELDTLRDNLLGSTVKTLLGKQEDSGDIDIAVDESSVDIPDITEKMRVACKMDRLYQVGKGVFSYAVPVGENLVQVDLMCVPSLDWAKFAYHSHVDSQYKAVVRTMLLVNTMKFQYGDGDLEYTDDDNYDGQGPCIRVRRSFTADQGLIRTFKMRPPKSRGDGRVKNFQKSTPDAIKVELERLGADVDFSSDPDPILDPVAGVEMMFGTGVKPDDALSVEQVLALVGKHPNSDEILKGARDDLKRMNIEVLPDELK